MRKFNPRILIVLLFAMLFSAAAIAAVQISGSSPRKFIAGNYSPTTWALDVYFSPYLPDDINGFNIKDRVHVYGRSEGNFQELFSSGWTPSKKVVWVPTQLLKNPGSLQVKVTVDGVDSSIYNIPIVPGPTQLPTIQSISPNFIPKVGSASETIAIRGVNFDSYAFTGVSIDGKSVYIGRIDWEAGNDPGATILISVPKEILAVKGYHNVRVGNRVGLSSGVNFKIGYDVQKAPTFKIKPQNPALKGAHTVSQGQNND